MLASSGARDVPLEQPAARHQQSPNQHACKTGKSRNCKAANMIAGARQLGGTEMPHLMQTAGTAPCSHHLPHSRRGQAAQVESVCTTMQHHTTGLSERGGLERPPLIMAHLMTAQLLASLRLHRTISGLAAHRRASRASTPEHDALPGPYLNPDQPPVWLCPVSTIPTQIAQASRSLCLKSASSH